MAREDYNDTVLGTIILFMIGMLAGAILAVLILSAGGTRIVDIPAFGERVCAGVNLTFDKFEMTRDNSQVPVIHCKKPLPSIYDGVIIGE